ncbi:hypothetical protein CAPTEDRAFT_215977 [Capitella teleta]|uniref:Ribonuclease H2 subunit B n=1 Tax=Capitella teleta TaxID=283909 RepID=R7VHF9_CAPTE|nr:hypothetical protein CAPTEDRAFT_215977 [Capitella teleta]|eukprot:ELU15130.1 hypothetical protein CAPTEDRAFT_215977 [Capitella teleta]
MPQNTKKSSQEKKENSQRICIVNDELLKNSDDNKPFFCQLRHPRSDDAALFAFSQSDSIVHEVLSFKEDFRSWFIGDFVQSDGSLYITSQVDPLYLVLPYLIKSAGRAMPIGQILQDEDFPETRRLCSVTMDVSCLADKKGDADLKAFKYNKDATLRWLKLKVNSVAEKLQDNHCQLSGAQVSSYIRSSKSSLNSEDDCMRFAHGVVSDYLPCSLSSELKTYLGIVDPVVHEKPTVENAPQAKKSKTQEGPLEDYSSGSKGEKKTPAQKLSIAQKKLSKVDKSGMKSISSFFGAKTAKPKV